MVFFLELQCCLDFFLQLNLYLRVYFQKIPLGSKAFFQLKNQTEQGACGRLHKMLRLVLKVSHLFFPL